MRSETADRWAIDTETPTNTENMRATKPQFLTNKILGGRIPFTRKTIQIFKALALIIGCLGKFSCGTVFVFNVYHNALKHTYNYTQSEVELISAMLNLGIGIGFPAGVAFDHWGPTSTSYIGLVSTASAYTMIWSATKLVDFYRNKAWLMSLYFILAGHGTAYTYMVCMNANVMNFATYDSGKIMGILSAFFAGSTLFYAFLYSQAFVNGHIEDAENQNLDGFFLTIDLVLFVTNALCVAFLRVYEDKPGADSGPGDRDGIEMDPSPAQTIGEAPSEGEQVGWKSAKADLDLLKLPLDKHFELILWTYNCLSSACLVFVNNVTVVSKSARISRYDHILVLLIPISNTAVSITIGFLSDFFRKRRVDRLVFILVAAIFATAGQIIPIVLPSILATFIAANLCVGVASGILWSVTPTVVSEMFGLKHFGRNWGIILLTSSLASMAFQQLFGRLYDANVNSDDGITCYGVQCFHYGFVSSSVLSSCAILLSIILLLITRIKRRKMLSISL